MRQTVKETTDVCIVIVNYNGAATLVKSVRSIIDNFRYEDYLVVVVDNDSTDGSMGLICNISPKIRFIYSDKNIGFGGGNNLAFSRFQAKYYYLHNSDAYLCGRSLDVAIEAVSMDNSIGILGLPLQFPDGRAQSHAYTRMTVLKKFIQCVKMDSFIKMVARDSLLIKRILSISRTRHGDTFLMGQSLDKSTNSSSIVDVDWVCGASMILSADLLKNVGNFDENFFMYYEDEDLCWRAHASSFRVVTMVLQPVVHDFGWGKSKIKAKPSKRRLESAAYFVDKHFSRSPISRLALKLLMRISPKSW
nr:glycosyltransferase family 2 protein [Methylobacterium sp. GC_Met_2]